MFDSQTIQVQGTASTVLYSPWFPRGGDYGIFTLEVTSMGGTGPKLEVALFSKNSSEVGDPAQAITTLAFDLVAVGRKSIDFKNGAGVSPAFGGFKELVRFQFTLSGTGATTTTSWATFRMLQTVWYDKV